MTRTGQHQRYISALAVVAMLVTALIGTRTVQAQTYTVYRFKGSPTDGAIPGYGHLIGDSTGNLYGTTQKGGASGFGSVFKLDKTGETVLYSFTGGADGWNPDAGLIRDSAGNLYGTTFYGGVSNAGVVFKLDTTGTETVLYSFTGGADASGPGGLVRDSAGNFYGTSSGGASGQGTVFKLDTIGTETVLYSFTGRGHGSEPGGDLVLDMAGNLYGTASGGGASDAGVVFKVDTTGKETVLYSFTGGADGNKPAGGVIRDSAGNFYGSTGLGGQSDYGVVFKLDITGKETVLYSFTGGADGSKPAGGVIRDSAGNLYGTTSSGGTSGYGVVFKLDPTGTETVLHSFTGGAAGSQPSAGVSQDSVGNLYGTTYRGGIADNGAVFKLQP